MKVVSWLIADPPDASGFRWINEYHIVNGERHELRWLCHRRINPQSEINRRAREFAQEVPQ